MNHQRRLATIPAILGIILVLAAALCEPVSAAPPGLDVRILDHNAVGVPEDLSPSRGVYANGLYFFEAGHDDGEELFVSDGTTLGTYQLADMRPGPRGSYPDDFVRVGPATAPTTRVFFTADLGLSGRELWVSDGTAAGTQVVIDPDPSQGSDPFALTPWDGNLYFAADFGSGPALFRVDPVSLAIVALGMPTIGLDPDLELEPSDGTLYFEAFSGSPQIYGTNGGAPIAATSVACDEIGDLIGVGGEFFFVCETGVGTFLMQLAAGAPSGAVDVHVEPAGTTLDQLTAVGGLLYFVRDDEDLLAYDNGGGTVIVVQNNAAGAAPTALTPFDGNLLYSVDTPGTGREPWLATGTSTAIVEDVYPGSFGSHFTGGAHFEIRSGVAFFDAKDASGTGDGLWRTEGAAATTSLVRELSNSNNLVATPLGVFFRGGSSTSGQLWLTDGTETGTVRVDDLPSYDSSPNYLVGDTIGDQLFFQGDHPLGREPAVSDGTAAGTRVIIDLVPGPDSASSATFHGVVPAPPGGAGSSAAIFSVKPDAYETQIWATDGTETGTELLAIPEPGSSVSVRDGMLLGNRYVFAIDDDVSGEELWVSDGTAGGTRQLLDLFPGTDDGVSSSLDVKLGSHLYFNGNDGVTGVELWRTDGTVAGTELVIDLRPGSLGSYPGNLVASSSHLYFFDDGSLWVSDGTAAGTTALGALEDDSVSQAVGGDDLWVVGWDDDFGNEVWYATPTSLQRITDFISDTSSHEPTLVGAVGGRVVFWADNGTGDGLERLWSTPTNGAVALLGTFDARGDNGSLRPTVWNDWLYFQAETAAEGVDLWRTNGLIVEAVDLAPGPASSVPEDLTVVGDRVFFSGWDPVAKRELFVVTTSLFHDGFESNDTSAWSSTSP